MSDTSTEAVEAFIQGPLKEAVLSEGMPTTPEDTQDVYAAVGLLRALAAERDALRAENKALRNATVDVGSALVAAVSLLEKGGKDAVPSNKMFEKMLSDYKEAISRARAALKEKNDE